MHVHACGRNLVGCAWMDREGARACKKTVSASYSKPASIISSSRNNIHPSPRYPPPPCAQSPIACVGCVTQETQFMGCEGGAVSLPTSRPRDALYDTSLFLRKQVAPRCHHDLPIAFTVQHSISHSFLPPPPSLTPTSITNHRLFIGMIKE